MHFPVRGIVIGTQRAEPEAGRFHLGSIGRVSGDDGFMSTRPQFERERHKRMQVAERTEGGEDDAQTDYFALPAVRLAKR